MSKSIENKDFNNRQLIPLLTALALFIGVFIGATSTLFLKNVASRTFIPSNQSYYSSSDNYDIEYIDGVIKLINEKYLPGVELTKEEKTYGMIKGLVASLGDRYTMFFDPQEAQDYLNQAAGEFEGIGVVLSYDGQFTYVETVLKDHPASLAGIQNGDIILKVDDDEVRDLLPARVAQLIRGEKGTNVTILILRMQNNNAEEVEFTITRNKIEVANIEWEKVDNQTAKINIVQFSDKSAAEFNKNWDNIVKDIEQNMPGLQNIIVDLRNNPGGYVFSVRYVLEEFLPQNAILMKEKSANSQETDFKDNRRGKFENQSLAVLVNEGSASASEIFAAAIQENNRGKVVGKETVGKGVEQELLRLKDGSILLVVFQQWLTPKGNQISEDNPIKPDYVVEYTQEDFRAKNDTQLKKALEVLK